MATHTTQVCAPCQSRGISLTAVKYCKTCRESLCKMCVECHKTFKATKNHLLVQSMGQNAWKISCDIEKLQMCPQHPSKQTEFYCDDHDTLLCSLCLLKSESHKYCAKVIEIDTAGKSFLTTHFTDIVSNTCLETANTVASAVTEVEKAKEDARNSLEELKNEIESIRSKLLQAFDRQSNNIIQHVSADLLANTCKCEKASQNLRNLAKEMRESENLFENVTEYGSPADVFRCVKSIIGQCEDLKSEIEQTKRHCLRQNITSASFDIVHMIEQNPFLFCNIKNAALEIADISTDQIKRSFKSEIAVIPTEIMTKDKYIPRMVDRTVESKTAHRILPTRCSQDSETTSDNLDFETSDNDLYSSSEQTPTLDIQVSYRRNFKVELSDGRTPWFGGIVCLHDERVVLSDYNNSRIIMVKNERIVMEESIDFTPGHLTLVHLVVCHMNTNELSLMKLKQNGMREYKCLVIRFHPKYVQAVDNNRILVASRNGKGEWLLDLLKSEGNKWRSVRINIKLTGIYDGYKLAVQHLPDSDDGFRIIQYCEDLAVLHCFHEAGGSAIFQFEAEHASSVITDHLGYIFIIRFPGEIQVLSPDGTLVSNIKRKALHKIKLSAFNKSADKLFVTKHKDSRIHILDVKREESAPEIAHFVSRWNNE